ncbi:MBL fold metallo-hydrolase [Halalkalirubrum salinum]|uniref:MBL fold metallo-hydrolase n=1 Tax=Halalkalirubrum salinum TaxID=2563889 RepID=UPI0010FB75D1|nr:MBL fold metallo-hydrolase [Halalkalirubrum salinum]
MVDRHRTIPRRISLTNTIFEGNNNVYLLDGERTILVDTGVSVPAIREELADGLAAYGVSYADIDEIFLTHWHYDHAGLAGEIQAESSATVYVHEADAALVAGDRTAIDAESTLKRQRFDEWSIPEDARRELEQYLSTAMEIGGQAVDVTPITDGDTFERNGGTLEAVHLPGHAAGLTAYAFEGETGREAFVGDVILPRYTPNVGGADVRVERPLETYLRSLERFIELDFERAWPGHRAPIDDPSSRAATIIAHHRDRTERVISVLEDQGPADVWTVSAHLFGSLSGIHILHGPGEAYAHLDHVRAAGIVTETDGVYALSQSNPSIESLFPSIDQ